MHRRDYLYAQRMDLELRHLRVLVAVADAGSFTDAAIDLGISQAAASRTLIALEQILGARLLYRTSRNVSPTTAGVQVLVRARQVLADAANLLAEATTGHTRLRIGHAWSAMGQQTLEFQRRWAAHHPEVELHLVRTNSPTGGLAEGLCDLAVVRIPVAESRFAAAVVGLERRYCAMAADDPWARRRTVRLTEMRDRDSAHRPAHRQHDGRTVARWRRAGAGRHAGHRRLAGADRGRPRHRHHAGEHGAPVPPRGRRVSRRAGRAADHGPADLAPRRPASVRARGDSAADGAVPAALAGHSAPMLAAVEPDVPIAPSPSLRWSQERIRSGTSLTTIRLFIIRSSSGLASSV